MRVTGGEAKGRKIKVPKGIRPTQDKIRSAIFDILRDRIKKAKFIDLFAGSGSVGIEALSRGADKVVFVEKSKKVLNILKENLKLLGYIDRAKIIGKDVFTLHIIPARHLAGSEGIPLRASSERGGRQLTEWRGDIIFADPPYEKGLAQKVIFYPAFPPEADEGQSILIIEHSKREKIEPGKHYKFGDTILTFIPEKRLTK